MTSDEIKTALAYVKAIAEAIKEAKEIPSGHLYAVLMDKMNIDQYNQLIGILKRTGLVTEDNHLLKWNEPGKGREL